MDKELGNILHKIDLLGSPAPQSVEESMQDKIVAINKPHKATKEDYEKKDAKDVPIDPNAMINKNMESTGSMYAEGIPAFQQYSDMNAGHNQIGSTQEPISSDDMEIIKKAAFSADAPNKEGEPIEGTKQQDKIEKMLDLEQTMYCLTDSDRKIIMSHDDKFGKGLYLYNTLERAKAANQDDQTILPVRVNAVNVFTLSDSQPWDKSFKDNLLHLGYDCIYIPTAHSKVFDLFALDNQFVKVIGQADNG
jgi:hypothetical protein